MKLLINHFQVRCLLESFQEFYVDSSGVDVFCLCLYVCVHVWVCLHYTQKWNVMLEGILVSWRTTHSTSKFLLQVQRTERLVFPALQITVHRSAPGEGCIACVCSVFFIAGNDNDEDFRRSWWHIKPESASPSLALMLGYIQNFMAEEKTKIETKQRVFLQWNSLFALSVTANYVHTLWLYEQC